MFKWATKCIFNVCHLTLHETISQIKHWAVRNQYCRKQYDFHAKLIVFTFLWAQNTENLVDKRHSNLTLFWTLTCYKVY